MQVQAGGSSDCCRYAVIITGAIFIIIGIAFIVWGVVTIIFDGLLWLIVGVVATIGGSVCCCIFCCMQPSSTVVVMQQNPGMPMQPNFQQQSLQQQPAFNPQV